MFANISTDQLILLYAVFWVFSAFAQALPEPTTASSPWYQFVYRFVQIISANIKLAQTKFTPDSLKFVLPEKPLPVLPEKKNAVG